MQPIISFHVFAEEARFQAMAESGDRAYVYELVESSPNNENEVDLYETVEDETSMT